MKKILLILLVLFNFALSQSISLEDCFHSAEQNHPLMKQKSPINEITKNQIKNINTKWLPSMDLNLTATYQSDVTKLNIDLPPALSSSFVIPTPDKDTYKSEIEINQLLFDGGLISVQKELIKQDNKISLQQLETNFSQIKFTISQVFYNLVLLQKQSEILDTWYNDLLKNRELLSNLIENGVMEKSDIYELDIKISELLQQVAENKIYQENNRKILCELTGMEITPNIQLYVPDETQFNNTFSNAQSILFNYQKDKLEIAQKMTFRNRFPKIFSFAKVGYGKPGLNMLSSDFDSYYMVGVGLQWNIWDWHYNRNEKEKLRYNRKILEFSEETYNQKIVIELDKYQSSIENLQQKIEKDEVIFQLNKKLKNSAAAKFKNGVINTTDYLKYDNNYVRAELSMELRKIQLYREKVNYQLLKGEL